MLSSAPQPRNGCSTAQASSLTLLLRPSLIIRDPFRGSSCEIRNVPVGLQHLGPASIRTTMSTKADLKRERERVCVCARGDLSDRQLAASAPVVRSCGAPDRARQRGSISIFRTQPCRKCAGSSLKQSLSRLGVHLLHFIRTCVVHRRSLVDADGMLVLLLGLPR